MMRSIRRKRMDGAAPKGASRQLLFYEVMSFGRIISKQGRGLGLSCINCCRSGLNKEGQISRLSLST